MIFDLWSHAKKREIFGEWSVLFVLKASDCSLINCFIFWQYILCQFQLFLWLKYWKLSQGLCPQHLGKLDPKTTSCKACNKFKALCLLFFITFLFFHQMITLQKLWKMFFISSKKLFSFSRYLNFYFFPSFPNFPDSKGQMEVE